MSCRVLTLDATRMVEHYYDAHSRPFEPVWNRFGSGLNRFGTDLNQFRIGPNLVIKRFKPLPNRFQIGSNHFQTRSNHFRLVQTD